MYLFIYPCIYSNSSIYVSIYPYIYISKQLSIIYSISFFRYNSIYNYLCIYIIFIYLWRWNWLRMERRWLRISLLESVDSQGYTHTILLPRPLLFKVILNTLKLSLLDYKALLDINGLYYNCFTLIYCKILPNI